MSRHMLFPPFRDARSPNAKRRPDLHRSPSPRSSRSTSSVVRWTRSTTSVTCPSSRTSTTYVPQPNGARAFPASIAPTHRSLSRNRRRQGLALRVGKRTRAASASRTRAGDPDASEASPAPPATARTRLARHPTPSRPRPRAPPPDANCPRTPTRRFVAGAASASGACSENPFSRGIFHFTKKNDRALTPQSLPHSSRLHTLPPFDVTGQVHPHGLPRRRRGYHRAGERGRRAPDGHSSG